jgi:hypothetical protein
MDCKKWLLYPVTGYLAAIVVCELAGIDRGTTVSLSLWAVAVSAGVLGPLGFFPALCLYFNQRTVSGSVAWRFERASPFLTQVVGMAVAAFFGLGTFGAGLYFANLSAQHGAKHVGCVMGKFLGIHHSLGKRRGCRAWARIMLPSGRIVRPCLTAPVWASTPDDSQMREDQILFITVNESVFGRSIGAVVSKDDVGLLGSVNCPDAGSVGADANRAGFW